MTDLITRLEQATEGSQELDSRIAISVAGRQNVSLSKGGRPHEWKPSAPKSQVWETIPPFSTSLDAALTLTPAHMHWKEIIVKALDLLAELYPTGPLTLDQFIRCVCIAALRARE